MSEPEGSTAPPSRLLRAVLLGSAVLAVASSAAAQLALPVSVPSATLTSPTDELVYTIDLDTLPARPRIDVEVVPDGAHADAVLEIELTNFVPDLSGAFPFSIGCPLSPGESGSWLSAPTPGAASLEADLFFCHPGLNTWNGVDAEVQIRVLDFGSAGSPLDVSVEIEGVTQVPTELLLQQVMGPRTVTAVASQDTVLYADDHAASNGAGQFLWAGTRVVPFFGGPGLYFRYPRHSLLQFSALTVSLPSNAVVTDAALELFATGISSAPPPVDVYGIAPGPFWLEGPANASGTEFSGVFPGSNSYADWADRTFSQSWATPGGDTTTGTPLDSKSILSTGLHVFDSPGIAAGVQAMVDADDFSGFLVSVAPGGILSNGVQFASEDHPDALIHPTIIVDFEQSSPLGEGRIDPDLVDFLDEGEDFRWIYDLDEDGIHVTAIGGVCETTPPPTPPSFTYPYSYAYTGAPGYVGTDCCTWRIYSDESDVVGTGQALFFHNLDPSDPANMPGDFDGDGIRDGCDSCDYAPNGPALGSCMTAGGVNTGPCRSDLECAAGETCDLSQLDDDGDGVGNACPEPGLGVGLAVGGIGLLGRAGRTRRRAVPRPGIPFVGSGA